MKDDESVGPLPAPTAPVAVFWDLENCHVPNSVEAAELVGHIFTALRQRGLSGVIHIQAYADTSILPVEVNSGLSSTGVHLLHVARGRKEASDKAILVDMVLWALDHPPPAHFLLISGDRDFSNVLHRLKFRQYNIMLATTLSAKPSLINAASLVWDWAGLARGEQLDPVPKAKRQTVLSPPPSGDRARPQYSQRESSYNQRENTRQGGPSRGESSEWGEDEPQRTTQLLDASKGKERDGAARGGEAPGRGVPAAVRQMLGEICQGHPDGCSVGEVMTALRSAGFKINWVSMGFSNLLGLLKALPDVCLVDEDVRTKDGYKLTRVYPARQSAASSRRSSGDEPNSNAGYSQAPNSSQNQGYSQAPNTTQNQHYSQGPSSNQNQGYAQGPNNNTPSQPVNQQGQYKQSQPGQYTQSPPGQFNQAPSGQYNQTPPAPMFNSTPPGQQPQTRPLLHTPGPGFLGPRPNGALSPRPYDPRPSAPPPFDSGHAKPPPPQYYQGPPAVPFSEPRAEPRGPAPPRYPGPSQNAAPPVVAPGEFRTLVAVVWELQRQAGGQPPDQRQVISMLRNEHGELFASLGGYGPYETPFKYIEAAQRAGYLDIRAGPTPGSVALALTPKAGEHAYDIPQNPPQNAAQPPRMPHPAPPSGNAPPPRPAQPPPVQAPPAEAAPRLVISADPPEAEALTVPLPPVLLKGTAASLRRDLMAPTEANIRARVVQLMRPQSVMAGGNELKQWFVPDPLWDAAVKAAIADGALVPSSVANRDVLLPQGMPSWRFVDPHFVVPYSAQQWAALEDCLRTPKGRAAIEGSYTRYAAARGVLQAGVAVLKDLALGQMINLLQAAVKKGWILPGPSWRPARVMLAPSASSQPNPLPSPSSGPSNTATGNPKSPSSVPAAPPSPAPSVAKKKDYPPWLVKLRAWLPLFLHQIGPKGFALASLKGTFRQASGIEISEADLRDAGFLKFSQMLASMPDVCTLHTVMYHGTNKDYVLHIPGWTLPPNGAPTEAPLTAPPVAAMRAAGPSMAMATFFPKEVGLQPDKGGADDSKARPAVDRETVKRDTAQLLAELLPKHPDGINAGGIKILFANRFGYQLDHEAVGFPKLRDLLQALPASCRLTFHPYIMIHARTAPAKELPQHASKPDRKAASPIEKSAVARTTPAEGHSAGLVTELPAEKVGGVSDAVNGESAGPVGGLSLLPGSPLSLLGLLGSSSSAVGTGNKVSGEESFYPVEVALAKAPAPVSFDVSEGAANLPKQPRDGTTVGDERDSRSAGDASNLLTVATTKEAVSIVKPAEALSGTAGTSGQGSPGLPDAPMPIAVGIGEALRATPGPAKVVSWSPDSLATPVAETPDHKMYSVKPSELRSRLAKEVHAIQEETEGAPDADVPEGSPVSIRSVSAAPSEDADSQQRTAEAHASQGQNHVGLSEGPKLSDVSVVSDGSESADLVSDAESGTVVVASSH